MAFPLSTKVIALACVGLLWACGDGEDPTPTGPTGPAPVTREPTVKAEWETGSGGGSSSGSSAPATSCQGNSDCEPPLICSQAGRCVDPEEAGNDAVGGGFGGGGFGGGGFAGCLDDSDCLSGEVCDLFTGLCLPGGGGGGGGLGGGYDTGCWDDSDCAPGQACDFFSGECYEVGAGSPCIDDYDCDIDEICYQGTCEPY